MYFRTLFICMRPLPRHTAHCIYYAFVPSDWHWYEGCNFLICAHVGLWDARSWYPSRRLVGMPAAQPCNVSYRCTNSIALSAIRTKGPFRMRQVTKCMYVCSGMCILIRPCPCRSDMRHGPHLCTLSIHGHARVLAAAGTARALFTLTIRKVRPI